MCSNPCESEVTCFRLESNQGPYGLLNFLCAALSTTELWWRMNHRKSFRTLLYKCKSFTNMLGKFGKIHPRMYHLSNTPIIDHLVMRKFVSRPPRYRSINCSRTLPKIVLSVTNSAETWQGDRRQRLWPYTRSMCMWRLINKWWVLFKHSKLKWEWASKNTSFLKELCSKSANCSRTFPKTGLSVKNSLVYGAAARRSAHELSHD